MFSVGPMRAIIELKFHESRELILSKNKLPTGRWSRLASAVGAGARSGMNLFQGNDGEAAAKKAALALGQLRGIAAKVGQMASYVDGVVPEGKSDAYEKWMKTLRDQAPRSSSSAIAEAVKDELGASVETLFLEWGSEAVASASIGQVHRGRLLDGRVVAIKVQHPGIGQAIESDLKSAGLIEGALGLVVGTRKFNSKAILEEIRTRFREELRYELEGTRQTQFRTLFADVPEVNIPEVIAELSSQKVLTTEWVDGLDFDQACAAPDNERRAWAETLWHFVYRSNLMGGLFNADPHPGNYIFQADGRIAFIDFGCVQPLPTAKISAARRMHWAARHRELADFDNAAIELLDLQGGRYQASALAYVRQCFRPLIESPFKVTRPFVVGLVDRMKDMILEYRKAGNDGYVPLPDGLFFVNRLQFGFYSVLARLNIEADFASVERQFLTQAVRDQIPEEGIYGA
jgi:predicted unusual protein kinase regulating ubiquinone biosynthesis (AarF/ABC1/UbiB family)